MKRDYLQPKDAPRNLTGQRFGALVVVRQGERGLGRQRWVVRCDCGSPEQVAPRSALLRGAKLSCGCRRRDRMGALNASHRMCTTPTYLAWRGAIGRCENQSGVGWHNYGARGIRVCERWRGGFEAFLADMGERPSKDHSLDRIDNERGYDCGRCNDCAARGAGPNCRWATRTEQGRNRRTNQVLELNGQRACVAEWAERIGVPAGIIFGRLYRGWSVEKALAEPYQPRRGAP